MGGPSSPAGAAPRSADPYRDLAVIDGRAPRFNQAVVGAGALLAAATGWWPVTGLLALQLALGLTLGRRWCLPCVAYFELVQPWVGEGELEDSRPPRFANQVGLAVLSLATAAGAAGLPLLGRGLALVVAALALLAAGTGFCAGCELYRLGALLRGRRRRLVDRVDLLELGAAPGRAAVVQFTHPLCGDCQALERRLRAGGHATVLVDVSRRPELARKYGVAVVPLALEVDPDGAVRRAFTA